MTIIVAEAGVNHNGCLDTALQLVDSAASSGADIVKFQTFKAKNLVSGSAKLAKYQQKRVESNINQRQMLADLELAFADFEVLADHCAQRGIEFLSTAFDSESLDFLTTEIDLRRLKIPSGEITNAPFVLDHAKTGKSLIISTGMSDISEIETALGVVAYGLTSVETSKPSMGAFQSAYQSIAGKEALREKVTLLHCTSEYPAPIDQINLRAMDNLAEIFSLPIGYSDHSDGILVSVAAAARGASIVEKHFTLDASLPGPDHKASIEPAQLKLLVEQIRVVESALGSREKTVQVSERDNRSVARKSLHTKEKIREGERFSDHNVIAMRPGTGMPPDRYWELLGKQASRDYSAGEPILE